MNTEWGEATKRTVVIGVIFIGVIVLYISRPVIPFLILAVILAFLLDPIIILFSKTLRLPRWAAVIIAYLLLLLLIALAPIIIVPSVINAVQTIDIDIIAILKQSTNWANETLTRFRYLQVLGRELDLTPLVDPASQALTGVMPEGMVPSMETIVGSIPSAVEIATGFASTIVGTVLSAILAFILTLVYSIYISFDMQKINQSMFKAIPPAYQPEYSRLIESVKEVWMAYFRGQVFLSLIVGTVTALGTLILGLPGALILGIIAGLLEVLPILGPILAAIPAVILALIVGSSILPVSNVVFALIVIAFYIVVQQLENNILVPRVIGNAIEVHPILVMAAVIVGASVAGILGAFLAAPVVATGRVLGQYIYNKLLGLPPFPPTEESAECQPSETSDDPSQPELEKPGLKSHVMGLFKKQAACPDSAESGTGE